MPAAQTIPVSPALELASEVASEMTLEAILAPAERVELATLHLKDQVPDCALTSDTQAESCTKAQRRTFEAVPCDATASLDGTIKVSNGIDSYIPISFFCFSCSFSSYSD